MNTRIDQRIKDHKTIRYLEYNNTKPEMLSRKLKAFLENAVRRQRFIESSGLDTYDHLYKKLNKKIFLFLYTLLYIQFKQ